MKYEVSDQSGQEGSRLTIEAPTATMAAAIYMRTYDTRSLTDTNGSIDIRAYAEDYSDVATVIFRLQAGRWVEAEIQAALDAEIARPRKSLFGDFRTRQEAMQDRLYPGGID